MNKHLCVACAVLLLALLFGCDSDDAPMTADELRKFAAEYTDAWNSQDAASVAAFFAEDGTLYVNGSPAAGHDAIAALAQGFMTAFPDMVLVMDAVEINTSSITYRWTFVGINTGPDGTGNAVRFSGYEEWTLGSNDLIAVSMGHFDSDEYQHQLQYGVDTELTDEQQVLAVELEWINAEVNDDEAVLNRVLDDRFIINSNSGRITEKVSAIASIIRMNMVGQTLSDQTVLIDGDTAIVMGTAHFTFAADGEDDKHSSARYITTYIKRDDRWRALALQMSGLETP